MDRTDLARQLQIPSSPQAHRPFRPGVEPAPRHVQQSAHHPHRVGGLVHLHEPEERFKGALSVANQAAAFQRISRSSFRRRFSRRSRVSSSRSALVSPPSPLSTSRDTVEGDRPRSFAIDRQDSLACMPLDISSRSTGDNRSAERGLLLDFRPPDPASSRCTDFDEQPMTKAASSCVCPERMRACRRPRSSGVSRCAAPDP